MNRVPVFLSLAFFLVFLISGYAGSDGVLMGRSETPFMHDIVRILKGNLGSLVFMYVTTVFSFGMCGLVFFALNGYMAGSLLGVLTGDRIVYFLLFAPVEVSAFVLAFASAFNTSRTFVRSLRYDESFRPVWRLMAGGFASPVLLLLVAAFLEAVSIKLAWG